MSRVTVRLDFSGVLDVPTATDVPEYSFPGFSCVGVQCTDHDILLEFSSQKSVIHLEHVYNHLPYTPYH